MTLIYSASVSLDGYVEDAAGSFDWTAPSEEVHAFVNENLRPVGTYLFGRRMYETMRVWETFDPNDASKPVVVRDFASIWHGSDKVVYSRTLESVITARTKLERDFDPAAVTRLKGSAPGGVCVGGAELAGHAFAAGLVDECHLFVCPIVVGGGKRALARELRVQLELMDERRFSNGVVYLRYALASDGAS